jgi:hypothetical protein
MLAYRVTVASRLAMVMMAALLAPIESRAQPAAPQQTPADDPYKDNPFEVQYRTLLSQYAPQIQQVIAAERQRLLIGKGKEDDSFWTKVQVIHVQFDKAFVGLLQAATRADPPEAVRLWTRWEREEQVTGGGMTTPAMIAQVDAAKPDWQQAAQFVLDTLVKTCNEGNAMVVASKMIGAERVAELAGSGQLPNVWQKQADCARKATLILDFDSKIDATWVDGFPTSGAHVRADGIKLTFDPGTDTFVAKRAHLPYLSFDFTKMSPWSCDTAYAEVGTSVVDITAKMTKTPNDSMYLIQIYPNVSEVVERPASIKMGSDRMSGGRCGGRKRERGIMYWTGFVVTEGETPFELKLGASDVHTGTPASFATGGQGVTFTQATIVALRPPGGG